MSNVTENELSIEIEKAAHKAFCELFENKEHFYYCSLITTGEALPPVTVSWSHEALNRYLQENNCSAAEKEYIEWSYAESPYLDYGSVYFDNVKRLFSLRPQMDYFKSEIEWQNEFDIRLRAMENAMKRLDAQGIFGTGKKRLGIVINVETMPPDYENTLRAKRLNPTEALSQWLKDVAEPKPI